MTSSNVKLKERILFGTGIGISGSAWGIGMVVLADAGIYGYLLGSLLTVCLFASAERFRVLG